MVGMMLSAARVDNGFFSLNFRARHKTVTLCRLTDGRAQRIERWVAPKEPP
jgi:hypothetical protein